MSFRRFLFVVCALSGSLAVGCGTTRVTDTSRTGTEQLLISNSVDQSISEMDFSGLAGKKVFFEEKYLDGVVDKGYISSSIRQQLLAHGCFLQEERKSAGYIVEARAGAVGTDRNDVLYGIPQMNVPNVIVGQPSGAIPELPLAKRTNRAGVAKIAVFAYNLASGQPVWQSGVVMKSSTAKDMWVLGAGPYSSGTLHSGTAVEGTTIQVPYDADSTTVVGNGTKLVSVTQAASWKEVPNAQPAVEVVKPGAVTDPNVRPAVEKRKE